MPSLERVAELARFYYVQRIKGFEPPREPHFDPASTPWFTKRLSHAQSYLEYGAGGSTKLAAELGIKTITVESDRYYARAVKSVLPAGSPNKTIIVDIGITETWGRPLFKTPSKRRLARWTQYPFSPFASLNRENYPDLALVDGRFRVACALAAARQARIYRKSCIICLDDYYNDGSPRNYNVVEKYLGTPEMHGRMAVFDSSSSLPIDENEIKNAAQSFW